MLEHDLEQVAGVDQVVPQVLEWQLHALADQGVRSEVHDGVDVWVRGEDSAQHVLVSKVGVDPECVVGHSRAVPLREVVNHNDIVAHL